MIGLKPINLTQNLVEPESSMQLNLIHDIMMRLLLVVSLSFPMIPWSRIRRISKSSIVWVEAVMLYQSTHHGRTRYIRIENADSTLENCLNSTQTLRIQDLCYLFHPLSTCLKNVNPGGIEDFHSQSAASDVTPQASSFWTMERNFSK